MHRVVYYHTSDNWAVCPYLVLSRPAHSGRLRLSNTAASFVYSIRSIPFLSSRLQSRRRICWSVARSAIYHVDKKRYFGITKNTRFRATWSLFISQCTKSSFQRVLIRVHPSFFSILPPQVPALLNPPQSSLLALSRKGQK